ncbi:hypothetical protein TEA_001196 [Camellia sinensis var. sinensis]|uniref:Uncharacterized protein n=1 Tax=Camellia sinensis var. sinensis TaxID=542762 RepID=A0A4V3WQ40_CAMSN|nr:hypothetical protein TEA_001196 [Camellia sinensis var. sinensis]
MIGLDQILSKSSSLITGGCKIAWKHIGYVIDYKKNIENLLNETEKFENELTRIDGRVERAKHIGLIPEADVLQWIASAKGIKGDVEALLVEATRENMWCLKCCPNVSQRYKLGKESKVKTASVIRVKTLFKTIEERHKEGKTKMIGLDQILSKSSSLITGGCKIAWKHIGYVIDYKKNIENLLNETEKFENELTGRVERAKRNGEIPEADVLHWIELANGIKGDVEALLVEATSENMWCLKCCPHVSQRHKLGKESKEKTASVISHKDTGRQYMTIEVAWHAPALKFGNNFSQGYVAFDSREEIFEEIMKALADPCIKMIGLYGPGGVGKTTMATEVGKLAKQNELFDDVVMATISQTLNEKAVKEKLALQLGLTLDGHAYQLYHRLNNGERNLVILDDVWKPLDLADIEIPITDGNKGCKVVITSRKRESRRKISVESEIPSKAKEVCDKCGGLPVAIRAVAVALKHKGKHAWKDALRQLKNYKIKEIADIDQNLLISLNWSYDRLEPRDARSCFLLCSLFPEDAEISIDELVRYSIGMGLLDENLNIFDEVRDRVLAMVDVLKTSCLLLDDTHESVVKMHDIIRDVAISISEDEKRYLVKHGIEKWPEKSKYEHYSAISLRFTATIHEFPNELDCRGLHTLVLKCDNDSPTDFPNNFFNGMENNLEVLDLSEMPIKSLPSSLLTLVKLRMLCLNVGRLMRDIALLESLRNLEILSLQHMEKVLLHDEDGTGFSELQYLEVEESDDVEHFLGTPERFLESQPQIPPGSFCNLCELRLGNCQFKFLFTHSIARGLERLQHLEIEHCEDMEEIIRNETQGDEEEIIFHHLKKMVLKNLPNLRSFYSSMKNTSTTEANNSNSSRPLFCEKVAFPSLEDLEISNVGNISGIIGDNQLKLQVQQEENESFWQLRNLPRLRDLRIFRCSKLKAIIVTNKERGAHNKPLIFFELRSLKLSGLYNLKSICDYCGPEGEEGIEIPEPLPLFNEKVVFPCLKELTIWGVGNSEQIWISTPPTNSFNKLASLSVGWCDELLYVAPSELLGSLQNLQSLEIKYCSSLKEIFKTRESNVREGIVSRDEATSEQIEIISVLPQLERVSLEQLPNLISFCSGYKLPPSVQLSIQECPPFQ